MSNFLKKLVFHEYSISNVLFSRQTNNSACLLVGFLQHFALVNPNNFVTNSCTKYELENNTLKRPNSPILTSMVLYNFDFVLRSLDAGEPLTLEPLRFWVVANSQKRSF